MKNIDLKLYRGKVISSSDPDEQGKVQVKLLPEMVDIQDSDSPWIPPFKGNSSSSTLEINHPAIGSLLWVLSDDTFFHKYYLPCEYNIPGNYDFSVVSSLLSNITGMDSTYENLIFTLYEDGGLIFHNKNDGSHGSIHNSGSYFVFDTSGNIEGYSTGTIKFYNDSGYFSLESNGSLDVNGNLTVLV